MSAASKTFTRDKLSTQEKLSHQFFWQHKRHSIVKHGHEQSIQKSDWEEMFQMWSFRNTFTTYFTYICLILHEEDWSDFFKQVRLKHFCHWYKTKIINDKTAWQGPFPHSGTNWAIREAHRERRILQSGQRLRQARCHRQGWMTEHVKQFCLQRLFRTTALVLC